MQLWSSIIRNTTRDGHVPVVGDGIGGDDGDGDGDGSGIVIDAVTVVSVVSVAADADVTLSATMRAGKVIAAQHVACDADGE